MIRSLLRKSFFILLAIVFVIVSLSVIVDCMPNKPVFERTQIWAHRGYTEHYEQNSIPAYRAALALGATGVEMDIYWDDSLKTFIVSHDKPYRKPYGKLLTLEMAMDSLAMNRAYFWLDLKNLDRKNADIIRDSLSTMLEKYNATNKFFVESANGWQLRKLDKAGIRTLYWVQYNRTFPLKQLKMAYIHFIIMLSNFDGITTAYYLYDRDFQRNFKNFPVFVWYINDADKIRELLYNEPVNVVLTNTNLFYLNRGVGK